MIAQESQQQQQQQQQETIQVPEQNEEAEQQQQQQQQQQQHNAVIMAHTISAALASATTTTAATTTTTTTAATSFENELSENFYVDNRRKQNIKIQVKLTVDGIFLHRETQSSNQANEQLIRIDDIIGTRCGPRVKKRTRGGLNSCKRAVDADAGAQDDAATAAAGATPPQSTPSDASAYLYIYAYVRKEKPLRRVQSLRILRFRTHDRYEHNLQTAERWHLAIRQHKGRNRPGQAGRQLLILLNPKSGSGKGRELFQKQVAPLLREAEVQYELHITTHAHYAQEFVRTRKDLLERYSGILVASGDGLFYEVLNGLMERLDWRTACRQLPLGIIPCGSGNGLAKSIAHHCNEPYEPKPVLHATLTSVAGHTTPLDVVRVELANSAGKQFVMYSFLSIGWGLIADIDIESERLRSIGPQRFTLWAIKRLITLRTYKGKLYYLPCEKDTTTPTTTTGPLLPVVLEAQSASDNHNHTNNNTTTTQMPMDNNNRNNKLNANGEFRDLPDEEAEEVFADEDHFIDASAEAEVDADAVASHEHDQDHVHDDHFADVLSLDRESVARPHTDSWHSAVSRRTAYYSIGGQSSVRSNRSRQMSIANRIESANAGFAALVPTGTLPPLLLPLDTDPAAGWCTEEDDYVMVHAAYTSHLASDCYFAPEARLNDGIMYLVVIRAGVGRPQLLNFLLGMSTGTHLPSEPDPYIRVIPVRAFRIEPSRQQHGILTIDGERVDYGPIQAEIFPGMINVMTSRVAATAAE